MRKVITLLIIIVPLFLFSQTNCPKYNYWLKLGQQALKTNPDEAFSYFRNAQIQAKSCKIDSKLADKGISDVYQCLKEQKVKAENNEKLAKKNEVQARAEKKRAEDAEISAKENAKKANIEKEKAIQTSDSLQKYRMFAREEMVLKKKTYSSSEAQKYSGYGIDLSSFEGISIETNNTSVASNLSELYDISVNDPTKQAANGAPNQVNTLSNRQLVNYKSNLKFYLNARKLLDSLDIISKSKKNANVGLHDDEAFMTSIINRLQSDEDNVLAKFLIDSTRTELDKLSKNAPNYDDLVFIYGRASQNYTRKLINLDQFEPAKKSIDEAILFYDSIENKTAIYYYGYAGLYNSYNHYFTQRNQNIEAFETISKSIELMIKAVSIDPNNSIYQRGLSVLLRNSTFLPDTLLSKNDKEAISKLGCDCANNIVLNFTKTVSSIEVLVDCRLDQATKEISRGNYKLAIGLYESTINTLDFRIKDEPRKKDAYIQKVKILVKISDFYIRTLKDRQSSIKNLESAVITCKKIFNDEMDPVMNYSELKTIYNDISDVIKNLEDSKLKIKYNQEILASFLSIPKKYSEQKSIQYVISFANKNIGEAYGELKQKSNSTLELSYFSKAITAFEKANILTSDAVFSENISDFCYSYSQSVKLYLENNEFEKAGEMYNKMITIFSDYYKKYPFDYYFVSKLKYSSMLFGEYLYKSNQYEKAISPLQLASYEGDKASSQYLIDIYSNPDFNNPTGLSVIQERIKYQSDRMKKFTIPTQFGESKLPFDVYVVDRDPLHKYGSIYDQAEWVARARGGTIPQVVLESFAKLQALAWKNNVSYGELCVYALGAAEEEKVLEKYKVLKDSITQTTTESKRKEYYTALFNEYESDIKKNDKNKDVIVKDALSFYNKYATFLIKTNEEKRAEQIIKRIYELDPKNEDVFQNTKRMEFVRSNKEPDELSKPKNLKDMAFYLRFYLEELDFEKADRITANVLGISDSSLMRDLISDVYFEYTGTSNFQKLFLTDTSKIKTHWEYLIEKDLSKLPSNAAKRNHYLNLIELDKMYLPTSNLEKSNEIFSQHYNSLAWYSLLSSQTNDIIYYLNKSIEYDPKSVYPLGNLPHAYLLKGEFEKAKKLYVKLKDSPFKEQNMDTYKDAFLSDFKEFEAAGIKNENFQTIIDLLNEK